jgi:hypothetical protein
MVGKAYASKKQKKDRPIGDFYSTPKSLIWCIEHVIEQEFDKNKTILEPCFGEGAISNELRRMGFAVYENDLHKGGIDYLSKSFDQNQVITNPPFSMWDEFVVKAKKESDKVLMIGRLNYFGTNSRFNSDIWDNLKAVYCFNRYVDYRTETRQDGKFNVGAMATAWFLWDKNYLGKPELNFIDVQPYATLGNFKFEEV